MLPHEFGFVNIWEQVRSSDCEAVSLFPGLSEDRKELVPGSCSRSPVASSKPCGKVLGEAARPGPSLVGNGVGQLWCGPSIDLYFLSYFF